jgi:hypothetical protein
MRERDSSVTRVAPVFEKLRAADPSGRTWLPRLVQLPVGGHPPSLRDETDFTFCRHGWGRTEVKLNPPVALLSWLIRNPRAPVAGGLSSDHHKAAIRRQWMEGSDERILEGLELLRRNPQRLDWHIFEGPTRPDVYLETKDLLVVIEGKRTEATATKATKWMAGRHQMLRHLDCAWEIRGGRQVAGFFIVEGEDASEEVPAKWFSFARETVSPAAIAASLPHRGPEEQKQIAAAFIGVTTWQRVCREFAELGLDYAALPDTAS